MNLKKYLSLIRSGILESLQFRLSTLITILGNLIYLVVIYYLWRSIFNSVETGTVNGMTFTDTMIYLVLASALFSFMQVHVVWVMGRNIQDGQIVLKLLKPMDFQAYIFFCHSGEYIVSFVTTFIPTFIAVYIVTNGAVTLGINLLFFLIAVLFGLLINFLIDYLVGTICLYTESIWGINIMKETVVLLLSGASIPIAFFPELLKKIVSFLPFQQIYNTPLNLLINTSLSSRECFGLLLSQLFWIIVLLIITRLFWKRSLKVITVNGG